MAAKILVVEDDPANAKLVEAILTTRGGFEVIQCNAPAEVLRLVDEKVPAAVLMDVALSGSVLEGERLDGIELTRRIRKRPNGASLPVILFTAHAMRGDRERFLFSSGANDYVAKPILDHEAFVELIRRHISAARETEG